MLCFFYFGSLLLCFSPEPEKKDAVLEQFSRSNSVRDRMRKFAEPSQSQNVPALKKVPLKNGTTFGSGGQINLSKATNMFTHRAASPSTSGDRPAKPRGDSTSHTSAASQSQATPQLRGVANKPLSSAGQFQNTTGGMRHPAEKDVHASRSSNEEKTPVRAAGQQVTQGEADPEMKTFLTIEIKDGRSNTSSTASPGANIIPITRTTPRITTSALGQRAGRTFMTTRARTVGYLVFNEAVGKVFILEFQCLNDSGTLSSLVD